MWHKFTRSARLAFYFSQGEALHYGASHVDPEHLLLAMMQDEHNLACRLLAESGVEPKRVRAKLRSYLAVRDGAGNLEFEPGIRAQEVVYHAGNEARALDHDRIGTEHLLMGMIRENHGLAAQTLRELRVGVKATRARLKQRPENEQRS